MPRRKTSQRTSIVQSPYNSTLLVTFSYLELSHVLICKMEILLWLTVGRGLNSEEEQLPADIARATDHRSQPDGHLAGAVSDAVVVVGHLGTVAGRIC